MKHILVGTAGHVDHGKTALIRALTGIETDRLVEEKSRGITIDLGFAHMTLPGGETVSIVDVPGHEKFIKNMLAGAGGIDLVLLVIAADDGVMPQTREHLDILQLLRAKDGIIALTKCDLADEEWQSLVCEDIRTAVADTFLQDAQIIAISSHTGQGIEQLKSIIQDKVKQISAKDIKLPFRIPVDRVFSAEGFGTVVTGTLIEGTLNQGDEIMVYPIGKPVRVRNIQVHGKEAKTAYAGQRVAVNISGIRREEITRGHVLAPVDTMQPTRMLDVKLSLLKDSPRKLKSGSRLHFHYGTHNVLCKAALMGADELLLGQTGYAQLRFTEDVAVKSGDSFVLRYYSPMETVGGGVVLNTAPKKHRKVRAEATIKALESLELGDIGTQITQAIRSLGGIARLDELKKRFGLEQAHWDNEIEVIKNSSQIIFLGKQEVIDDATLESIESRLISLLKAYHKEHPLYEGMRKEELRSRILPEHRPAIFEKLLCQINSHPLRVSDRLVALSDFTITYNESQQKIRDLIYSRIKQGGYTPPSIDELLSPNKKTAEVVFDAMLAEGVIVSTEPGIVFADIIVQQAKSILDDLLAQWDEGVTLAQFRDATGTSRKFALSLLEYFDRSGLTRKVGDVRILR